MDILSRCMQCQKDLKLAHLLFSAFIILIQSSDGMAATIASECFRVELKEYIILMSCHVPMASM